ncbi:E3 ubiquitin-protein ligase DTX1 [Liparis tanakae]|uniref:E3 ubiquitin-protein ligase DTX1 n=1 Tax=Liparis tanakae TaxID=230148 RepID=A0A4Z2JAS4_9TELE|nr:E3 ubiquitin-protein ligase DTX1 [Liparis tanakae]
MARPGSGLLAPGNGLGYPPQNLARVVVWEWQNEHGRWRPYSAAVCHHIENVLKGDARGTVVLGQVDAPLSPYVIDLQSMHQFRQDTGCVGVPCSPCGFGRSSCGWKPTNETAARVYLHGSL